MSATSSPRREHRWRSLLPHSSSKSKPQSNGGSDTSPRNAIDTLAQSSISGVLNLNLMQSTLPMVGQRIGVPSSSPKPLSSGPTPLSLRPSTHSSSTRPTTTLLPPILPSSTVPSGPPTQATKRPLNPALEKAVEEHIKTLSGSDKVAFVKAFSIDQDEFLARAKVLDDEHSRTSKVRMYAPAMNNILTILQRTTGGLSVAVQAISAASIIVGGAKLVIDLGLRFYQYFDQLSEMLEQVMDFVPLLTEYSGLSQHPDICKICSAIYLDLLKFYSATRKLFVDASGSPKKLQTLKAFTHTQWKPFQAEFGAIKTSLDHRKALLADTAHLVLLKCQQGMQVVQKDMQTTQREIQKGEFLAWLSKHNFVYKQMKTLDARYQGTGGWLFQTPEYIHWTTSSKSEILWCYGKPGSGKSVLVSQVIDKLGGLKPVATREIGLCFAYFTVDAASLHQRDLLIMALFRQLCQHRDTIPDWLHQAKSANCDPLEMASIENLMILTSGYRQTYIILDGLDECPERERRSILDLISSLRQTNSVFKIFLTSRRENDIARCFDRKGIIKLQIDSYGHSDDIESFIRRETLRLRYNPGVRQLTVHSDTLFDKIVSTLIEKADGMFLWVTLQLDNLCSLETDSDIEYALQNISVDLKTTYDRILEKIDRKDLPQKALAIACFRWLLSADRELQWVELETALTLAGSNPAESLDRTKDCPSIAYLVSACGNLVHIPKKTMTWWGDEQVTFMHSSVFQYFSTSLPSWTVKEDPWKILSDKQAMHCKNALECLKYVCLLIDGLDSQEPLDHQVDYNAWAHYAINYFDVHIIASRESSNFESPLMTYLRQILDRDMSFLQMFLFLRAYLPSMVGLDPHESTWVLFSADGLIHPEHIVWSTQLHTVKGGLIEKWPPASNTLRMLSSTDNFKGVQALLDVAARKGGVDVNDEDELGQTALYLACVAGYSSIVGLLLRKGACPQSTFPDLNLIYHDLSTLDTPLCAAIRGGHSRAIKHLIKAGVNLNSRMYSCGNYVYPLEYAMKKENTAITELLVANGAEARLFSCDEADMQTDDAVGGAEEY